MFHAHGLMNFCSQLALSDQTNSCGKTESYEKERNLDSCMQLFRLASFGGLALNQHFIRNHQLKTSIYHEKLHVL